MDNTFAYVGSVEVEDMVVAPLVQAGYEHVNAVQDAQVVLTHAINQSLLEDMYFDEQGLIQQATPGTLLIDLSATMPSFARELNAVATVSDLAAVEAPFVLENVFVSDALTNAENVTILVGGEEDAVEQATEYLKLIAHRVEVCGGAGSAELQKAAYTIQKAASIIAAVETYALFEQAHRSTVSLGGATMTPQTCSQDATYTMQALGLGGFSSEYTLAMFMGDVAAALETADDCDLILPQAESCLHLLELLMVIGGADMSVAALSLLYADEETCAEQGLDWTRAEQTFGSAFGDEDDDDYFGFGDEDDLDDYSDDEDGGYFGYPGFPGYSEN